MSELRSPAVTEKAPGTESSGFVRGLGLFDSTMIVVGSMIGSGIFIVSADIARHMGSTGGLLAAWVISGVLTQGRRAVYLPARGVFSTLGFPVRLDPFPGYPDGNDRRGRGWFRAVSRGRVASDIPEYLDRPADRSLREICDQSFHATTGRAAADSFSDAPQYPRIETGETDPKCIHVGKNACSRSADSCRRVRGAERSGDPCQLRQPLGNSRSGDDRAGSGLAEIVHPFVSLFSADAWNNITFTAGEVKNPRRDIPISLAAGTAIVITLYFLANVAYLSALSIHQIQTAPDDRVATATLAVIFGPSGATLMALAIMVSTFGCANGLILAGARVYYAMARDGLFFRSIGRLNANHVPAMGLVLQGIWAAFLVLLRTRLVDSSTGAVTYGNLYGVLLDYVIFAALMFYVLTIGGVLVLRRKRPDAERPYRAWGYPVVPVLYMITATLIMLILILYQTQDTWPGLVIVILGVPVYLLWSRRSGATA